MVADLIARQIKIYIKKGDTMKLLLSLSLWIIAAVLAVGSSPGFAEQETISCFALSAPPHYFKDASGQWRGIDSEAIKALVSAAGYRPSWVNVPWSRGLLYLQDGKIELMARLSRTPEREAYTYFLGIYMYEQAGIVMRKENAHIRLETPDDLIQGDYMWGIRGKSFYSEAINSRLENDPEFSRHFERESTIDETLRKVKLGRTTGCFRDRHAAIHTLRTDSQYSELIVRSVPFLPPSPIYIGISRKVPMDKRMRLQKAFNQLKENGKFEKIAARWLKLD